MIPENQVLKRHLAGPRHFARSYHGEGRFASSFNEGAQRFVLEGRCLTSH